MGSRVRRQVAEPAAAPGAASPVTPAPGRRGRLGAVAVILAVAVFVATFVLSIGVAGTAYVWHSNMVSDLGDALCRSRGGRWICSPGHALFNGGLIATGALLAVGAVGLQRLWGRLLAGSVAAMGAGLAVAGAYPAGDDGRVHLIGVVLALVVPAAGFLCSAIAPGTSWLHPGRAYRAVLALVALLCCAESRLPGSLLPRGAGELVIVAALVLALLGEAVRVLLGGRPVSRSTAGTAATASSSR